MDRMGEWTNFRGWDNIRNPYCSERAASVATDEDEEQRLVRWGDALHRLEATCAEAVRANLEGGVIRKARELLERGRAGHTAERCAALLRAAAISVVEAAEGGGQGQADVDRSAGEGGGPDGPAGPAAASSSAAPNQQQQTSNIVVPLSHVRDVASNLLDNDHDATWLSEREQELLNLRHQITELAALVHEAGSLSLAMVSGEDSGEDPSPRANSLLQAIEISHDAIAQGERRAVELRVQLGIPAGTGPDQGLVGEDVSPSSYAGDARTVSSVDAAELEARRAQVGSFFFLGAPSGSCVGCSTYAVHGRDVLPT